MKRIILDQALSLLCAGILMFGIPFACNGVILPIVIMEAIVQFNTVLLYPIALFLPLDLILGPRTEEAFFSRRALTFQCEFSESTSIWKESSARLDFYRQDLTSIFYNKVQFPLLLIIEIIKIITVST